MRTAYTSGGRYSAEWYGNIPGDGVLHVRGLGQFGGSVDASGVAGVKTLGRVVLEMTHTEVSLAAQGLISQNFDRQVVQANVQLTSGTVYAMGVPLVAGQVVTNGHVMISVAGADVTTGKIGLLSPAGARVALSANQTTEWQSTGAKTAAFSSAYTVPATGLYYVAVICIASTTQPSLYRAATTTLNNVIGTGQKPFGAEASQTDIDATVDLGASGLALWAGLS